MGVFTFNPIAGNYYYAVSYTHLDVYMRQLVDLLENPAVIKVGLSLKDDFMMLHKRAPFTQQSCIELQDYAVSYTHLHQTLSQLL